MVEDDGRLDTSLEELSGLIDMFEKDHGRPPSMAEVMALREAIASTNLDHDEEGGTQMLTPPPRDEQRQSLIDFVNARLTELYRDALLLDGERGIITETWVRDLVESGRTLLRMYENNYASGARSTASSLQWAVLALADSFKHHPDYQPDLWSTL